MSFAFKFSSACLPEMLHLTFKRSWQSSLAWRTVTQTVMMD
jgi:hypothetical protein